MIWIMQNSRKHADMRLKATADIAAIVHNGVRKSRSGIKEN